MNGELPIPPMCYFIYVEADLLISSIPESARKYRQSSELSGNASAESCQPLCRRHDVLRPGKREQIEPQYPLQVCLPR